MDMTQSKLSRQEWESIETPVSSDEKQILKLIMEGYTDIHIRSNETQSLFSFTKIENNPETESFLYHKYFDESIKNTIKKYASNIELQDTSDNRLKRLKSADNIRIQHLETNITVNKPIIFEFTIIDLCTELLKNYAKKNKTYGFYLYTLLQLKKSAIHNINRYVLDFMEKTIEYTSITTKISDIIENAYNFIEKNPNLLKYEDRTLYPHQKKLFSLCKENKEKSKLILYSAPTGTGKTLSPIGLASEYRIIFVCVARHIGLALAKSAISMEKKVAFAFGCETSSDIRLHYFAAVNYVKNWRSGAIAKVDNSEGSKVEIIICDVQSYITAMHYMLAFNPAEKIITYWDEPTITMDYENHELHSTIHKNWSENKIPNVVLSCATLPNETEIRSVVDDFREKFDDVIVETITSFDCKKSIPILNKDGYCVLPHLLYSNYDDAVSCVNYCEKNQTILRYFELNEIVRFITYLNEHGLINDRYNIDNYFDSGIKDITMNSLKLYYLKTIIQFDKKKWELVYNFMKATQKRKYTEAFGTRSASLEVQPSVKIVDNVLTRTTSVSNPVVKKSPSAAAASNGILITTSDAYTLTDGPTIFLTEDVSKIGNFYIQQSNISPSVFQVILAKISKNTEITTRIEYLEKRIQEKQAKTFDSTSKNQKSSGLINKSASDSDSTKSESQRLTNESQEYMNEINKLRKEIRNISLDPMYVPNTKPHQKIWCPTDDFHTNAFMTNIDEDIVKTIMMLNIENNLKVLLLLGIGLFLENANVEYMEIMKRLADQQRLFIIIASSDYVFGMNYQACHGFIGKDLLNMTQQKTMQAMGRIGRGNIQQDFTVRFRDDNMVSNLFQEQVRNIEAENMCKLFCSD